MHIFPDTFPSPAPVRLPKTVFAWKCADCTYLCTFSLFSAFRKCGGSGSGGYYGRGNGNDCHDAYEDDTGDEDD